MPTCTGPSQFDHLRQKSIIWGTFASANPAALSDNSTTLSQLPNPRLQPPQLTETTCSSRLRQTEHQPSRSSLRIRRQDQAGILRSPPSEQRSFKIATPLPPLPLLMRASSLLFFILISLIFAAAQDLYSLIGNILMNHNPPKTVSSTL